jgi:hypothetical protein
MTWSRRSLSAFVLMILLMGMQHGAQVHALEHVGEALKHTPEHSYTVPVDEVCALCALFAGGAHALADDIHIGTPLVTNGGHEPYAPTFLASAAPHFYHSRAPPVSL